MRIEATAEGIRALLALSLADDDSREHRPRDAAARRVPPDLLERYEALLGTGRRRVVAAIEQGRCSGCHVRLPTVLEQRARAAPAIHGCPNCRRMLYAPELLREGVGARHGSRETGRG